jgi:translation initiation factor IF-2
VVATVLVQNGTLRVGDAFVAGLTYGKVRAMFNERDQRVEEAGPSTPVQVLGFEDLPQAGDRFMVVADEREAREIALRRQQIKREQDLRRRKHLSLEEVSRQMAEGQLKELNIVLKGDVAGSVEALSDALLKLSNPEVRLNIIHSGVGAITESDVLLASASNAIIIGFQVRPSAAARKLAEQEHIDIRLYSIIYDAINDLRSALEGLLAPERKEQITGMAEVRATFKVPKVGTVAGCYVTEGRIRRNDRVRLIRDGVVVYEGRLASLKRFKEDVREVAAGYECGMGIEGYNDIKVGDIIEAYEIVETRRTLSTP